MVSIERINRYQNKLSFADQRLDYIEDWYQKPLDTKTRFAIYKVGQESIESIIDVIAMLTKDLQHGVKDDYSNIDQIKDQTILSNEQALVLNEANGLRNRLIHDYNGIDDEIALSSLMRLHPKLRKIIGELREWISQELQN